jgi:hypothetical protein
VDADSSRGRQISTGTVAPRISGSRSADANLGSHSNGVFGKVETNVFPQFPNLFSESHIFISE